MRGGHPALPAVADGRDLGRRVAAAVRTGTAAVDTVARSLGMDAPGGPVALAVSRRLLGAVARRAEEGPAREAARECVRILNGLAPPGKHPEARAPGREHG